MSCPACVASRSGHPDRGYRKSRCRDPRQVPTDRGNLGCGDESETSQPCATAELTAIGGRGLQRRKAAASRRSASRFPMCARPTGAARMAAPLPAEATPASCQGVPAYQCAHGLDARFALASSHRQPGYESLGEINRVDPSVVRDEALGHAHGHLRVIGDCAPGPSLQPRQGRKSVRRPRCSRMVR